MKLKLSIILLIASINGNLFGMPSTGNADKDLINEMASNAITFIKDRYACYTKNGQHERAEVIFNHPVPEYTYPRLSMFVDHLRITEGQYFFPSYELVSKRYSFEKSAKENDLISITCEYALSDFDKQQVYVETPLMPYATTTVVLKERIGNTDFKQYIKGDPVITFTVHWDTARCIWVINTIVKN